MLFSFLSERSLYSSQTPHSSPFATASSSQSKNGLTLIRSWYQQNPHATFLTRYPKRAARFERQLKGYARTLGMQMVESHETALFRVFLSATNLTYAKQPLSTPLPTTLKP
jgi:hypothetical protein